MTRRFRVLTLLTALAVAGCDGDDKIDVAPSAGPSTLAYGEARLDFPADGAQVRQCEIFRGTARLPADRTLILGVRNIDNGSPERYFAAVEDWEYPGDLAEWSGAQWFGSGDSAVGQRFRAELLIMDLAQATTAIRKAGDKGWHSPDNPEGTTVAAHIKLERVAGPGPAECT